jgi:tetratricopeptide (TPR) repeat protein
VLEAASVIGEVFEAGQVASLVPVTVSDGTGALLGALLRKDLVRPTSSDVGGGEALRFRHILLRDAAYDALPKAERASLHEAFAGHLEAAFQERAAEFDEFIGYHLERAHGLRRELGQREDDLETLARRAISHLSSAGRRAFQRGDMGAAANLLGRATDILDPNDPERIRLGWELGQALVESGSIAAATELLRDTLERARARDDEVAAGYAECALWTARVVADPEADVEEWEAAADRLIALFERVGDRRGAALAWSQKSYALWFREHLAGSGAAAERAIEHARAAGDAYVESDMRGHLLATDGLGPRPFGETIETLGSTLAEAREAGDRKLEQNALFGLGMEHAFMGRFEEGRSLATQARAISQELGLMLEYWARAQGAGRIEWMAGDLDRAARLMREACEQLEALGETAFLSTTAGMLAEVELDRGDRGAAERWLDLAGRTAAPGDRSSQTSIEVVRGRLLALDDDPRAHEHLRRSLELVDETDSPVWRSDVRISVARTLVSTRPDESRRLAREALELAEAKGISAFADTARVLLRELGEPA